VLARFGGICPVNRCAKHLLAATRFGSTTEPCEVVEDKPCVRQLMSERLCAIGRLAPWRRVSPR
jgi:Methylene-tetrahydrofolate reductase C terminal